MFLDILHQRLLLDDDPVWDPDTLQILEAVVFDEDVDCQDSESNLESGINHMSHHTRRHWTCIMLTKRISKKFHIVFVKSFPKMIKLTRTEAERLRKIITRSASVIFSKVK